jgi:hypothetical protein
MRAVKVPESLTEVAVEWTVGGALEIDETSLYYGNWNGVADVGCLSQPPSNLTSILVPGLLQTQSSGTGYFSQFGVSPLSTSATGESILGPVFKAIVDLSHFAVGDEVVVLVKARVDQSWVQQPNGIAPQVQPQAHIVNARTNPDWYHQSNGKIIQGRQDWYSTIPLTLVISNTTELEEIFSVPTPAATPTSATTAYGPTQSPIVPPMDPTAPSSTPELATGLNTEPALALTSAAFAHVLSSSALVVALLTFTFV